ncbi:MAG: hypothetical protein SNG27_06190 [Rikenellaceae bacterium]
MNKTVTTILLSISLCLSANNLFSQKLETQGGVDSRSVSTKIKGGVSSSRVIILSNISLSYSTNMGDIPSEDMGSGVVNKMNVDTLYFYLDPFDSHRRLIISADGFVPTHINLKLSPKSTHVYNILEPSKASDEFLMRERQYEEGCRQFEAKSWVSAINTFLPLAEAGYLEAEDKLCMIFRDIRIRETLPVEIFSKFESEAQRGKPYAQFITTTQYLDKYGLLTQREEELFAVLESAALSGSSYAQTAVATAYQTGVGVGLDFFKAIEWYERAATLDNSYAILNLAIMVGNGSGVKADKARAFELTKRAIDLGQEFAMENLGVLYGFGEASKNKDAEKSIYWFERAGNAGVDRAWSMIGLIYLNGTLLEKNYKKAYEYFAKGVELEEPFAMTHVGVMYLLGYGFKADRERGLSWFKRSADMGDRYGQTYLASYYFSERDYKEAWKWYKISGENRDANGYWNLGQMCENRQSPSPYKQKDCIEWYEKAATMGELESIRRLIEIYSKGTYVKKSREDEIRWTITLANVGYDTDVMIRVANAYLDGDGVGMNEIEAIKYLERAASLQSKAAMLKLAKLYREGIGVFVDEQKANEWEQKANNI